MAKKTKTQTNSLDARIVEALSANGQADRDVLFQLWQEAFDAIKMAETIIEAETPRLLDLSNDDPDQSRELIESSKLRIERLTKAILEIKPRVAAIDQQAAVDKWNAEFDALQSIANSLYGKLAAMYPPFLVELMQLHSQVVENNRAFRELRARAPVGVDSAAISTCRDYENCSRSAAPDGRFWSNVSLPGWTDVDAIFPARVSEADAAWNVHAANAIAQSNQAKALSLKLVTEEDKAEVARREAVAEAKLKEQAAKKRDQYHAALLEVERRRQLGG